MTRLLAALTAICMALPVWAAELGDDGLHKTTWMRDTFKDLREDLADANAEGKRLLLMVEQRGCSYCAKMHREVYPREELDSYIRENFFVVQINLHGDTELVDFDGESLTEKDAVRKWGVLFTPTNLFMPEEVPDGMTAQQAAVAVMPGAFAFGTTIDMFTWVNEKRYLTADTEDFQRYHARRVMERGDANTD